MWHRQYSTKYSPTFNMIVGEYSVKYCRSHKTLLWIWIMLCFVPFLRRQCHSKPLSIIIFLDLLFQEIKYTLVHCVCHMIRHSSMSQSYSSIEKIMYLTHNLIPWTVIIYKTFFHVMLKLFFIFYFFLSMRLLTRCGGSYAMNVKCICHCQNFLKPKKGFVINGSYFRVCFCCGESVGWWDGVVVAKWHGYILSLVALCPLPTTHWLAVSVVLLSLLSCYESYCVATYFGWVKFF